jgi:hypothetical protein
MEIEERLGTVVMTELAKRVSAAIPIAVWNATSVVRELPYIFVKVERGEEVVYRSGIRRMPIEITCTSNAKNPEGKLTSEELKAAAAELFIANPLAHEEMTTAGLKIWAFEEGGGSTVTIDGKRKSTLKLHAVAWANPFTGGPIVGFDGQLIATKNGLFEIDLTGVNLDAYAPFVVWRKIDPNEGDPGDWIIKDIDQTLPYNDVGDGAGASDALYTYRVSSATLSGFVVSNSIQGISN